MSIAFLFAGQGSQSVGMGKEFYDKFPTARKIYDRFPEIKKLCFEGPKEILDQTMYCQKAMLLTSYVIATILKENDIIPKYVAGLSLGEYSALAFSNTWELEDAIKIISKRGEIMQNALPLNTTTMAAVLGLDREKIKEVLSNISGICEIANYNCPGQIVITGEKKSVLEAIPKLIESGARRAIELNVSGAFHSSLLNDASNDLYNELIKYKHSKPCYNVVYNVFGREDSTDLNEILKKQICSSVYFEDSILNMIDNGVDTFVEIGPGSTLSSFVRKTNKNVNVYTVLDIKSLNDTLGGLKK